MCHDSIPLVLKLDLADLYGGVILPVAPLNLVLVRLLVLQNGELLGPALLHDFAGDTGLGRVRPCQHFLVFGLHREHGPEFHLFAYISLNALNADGVAGCDSILLTPGLDNSVHRSSKGLRQTTIIRGFSPDRQRAYFSRIRSGHSAAPTQLRSSSAGL